MIAWACDSQGSKSRSLPANIVSFGMRGKGIETEGPVRGEAVGGGAGGGTAGSGAEAVERAASLISSLSMVAVKVPCISIIC